MVTNTSLFASVNRYSLNSLVETLRVQSTRDCRADGMNLPQNPCKMLSPIWFQRLEYSQGLSDSKISLTSEINFVYQCLCMERTFTPENWRFSMSLLNIAQ